VNQPAMSRGTVFKGNYCPTANGYEESRCLNNANKLNAEQPSERNSLNSR
jgi:hypothetical protein